MEQMIKEYIEVLKYNFEVNNISRCDTKTIFEESYNILKLSYKIDLYLRRSNKEPLYTLIQNKQELDLFMKIILKKLQSRGYKVYLSKKLIQEKLFYKNNKENTINNIKKTIKKEEISKQVKIYRNLYSQLNNKNINLYKRRSNQQRALLEFIYPEEIDILNECFQNALKSYTN